MDQNDSENYWNRSTSKAFSFDDDDDEETNYGDRSKRFGCTSSSASSSKWDSLSILNDDDADEVSSEVTQSAAPLSLSIKSIISDEDLKMLLEEQSLEDQPITIRNWTPEEELKVLRRQIQNALDPPSAVETARKMLLGKYCTLSAFRSLHEKQQLLDVVLANGGAGGDAVLTVVIFLRRTLKSSIFYKLLQQRPQALQQYLSYLKRRDECNDCDAIPGEDACKVMQALGMQNEAALHEFVQLHQSCNDLSLRQEKLQQLLARYSVDAAYLEMMERELKLLEFLERECNVLDHALNADATPLEVLYACCRKHNNWGGGGGAGGDNSNAPLRLCAEQQISAAQFEWTALNERARAHAYADLECIFERSSTWHPLKQKQFHISFPLEAAVVRLAALQAPQTLLYSFIARTSNASDKLELARKVKCNRAIIDALTSLKDQTRLRQLMEELPARSEESFYCEKALKSLQSKLWSTEGIKMKL